MGEAAVLLRGYLALQQITVRAQDGLRQGKQLGADGAAGIASNQRDRVTSLSQLGALLRQDGVVALRHKVCLSGHH